MLPRSAGDAVSAQRAGRSSVPAHLPPCEGYETLPVPLRCGEGAAQRAGAKETLEARLRW